MSKKPNEQDPLRTAAEAKLAHAPKLKPRPAEELLHELQVHQIELEMQNEQLRQAQVELEKSRDRYVDFYDFAPDGYLTLSHDGMIDEINLTGATLLGVERNKLPHRRFAHFVATEDRDLWHRHLLNVLTRDGTLTCELALQRGDGSRFYAHLDCLRLKKDGEKPVARIVLTDITERKQAELAIAESESRFREIFNTVSDAIFIHDAETGRIINVNHRMREMYGLTREEALACGPDDLSAGTPPYSSAEAIEKIRLARTEGPQTFDWLARARDGRLFWVEVSLRFALIGSQQRILAVVRDITERKQAEEQIRNLAFYDSLTQLPNRRLLNDRLEQTMAASKRSARYGALMFLDLDNFKPLNDAHGHDVGDLLLVEAAHRLTSCMREMDTVARFGGDEFMVMLGELDVDKAESATQAGIVAEKIRAILDKPYVLKLKQEGKAETTVEHHCTSSIGVVLFINHQASTEEIIKWADMAMYQAKEAGGNLIRFYE